MKIACSSMRIQPGCLQENLAVMKKQIEVAVSEQADLIVFAQNALSGVYLGDTWKDPEFCAQADACNEALIEASDRIAIVWGNVRVRHGKVFNSAFFAWQKQTRMKVKKNAHGIMDESLYFTEYAIDGEIAFKGELLKLNFGDETYPDVFNINLDHQSYSHDETLVYHHSGVYVNGLSVESYGKNVLICPGAPAYYEQGELMGRGYALHEGLTFFETGAMGEIAPLPRDLDVLLYGLRMFDRQVLGGKMPWLIGLSGGLDSSVNAALVTMALGQDRVIAYNLATTHNSMTTKKNAQQLADALQIPLKNGSIEALVEANREVICKEYGYDESKWPSLVMENIQARIRGHLLSSFAAIHGGVVVNNGNKVEIALGYCTLYGDAIGVVAPLGDCTKVHLFELSHQINDLFGKEVIPANLLPEVHGDHIDWIMPPSAELKENQYDPMKWFYHDLLVEELQIGMNVCEYLRAYQSGELFDTAFGPWLTLYGLNDPHEFVKDFRWFMSTFKRNAFKQLQIPPLIALSRHPFGSASVVQGHMDQTMMEQLLDEIDRQA